MWRPENWEEYLAKAQNNRIGISWLSDHTYGELMEIGADAMLEALIYKGDALFIPGIRQATDNLMLKVALPNEKGYWVFIPDEENDESIH